jgi:2-dehydro-3-deoxyphosphogluconate aldolase/(4S)-4-hydroxy-2-oxoglutarate aldolase
MDRVEAVQKTGPSQKLGLGEGGVNPSLGRAFQPGASPPEQKPGLSGGGWREAAAGVGADGTAVRSLRVAAAGRDRPFNLREVLLRHRLLPTARLSAAEDAVPLAEALARAGLPLLQVSLATPAALAAIESIHRALPDFRVGACSVLSPGQVNDARAAGACFGSGPAMHPGLLAAALSAEFPFLPGAMTPSEIECGIQSGFLTQCFSPAAAAGGVAMVRALVGPYRHTRLALVPAGGLRMSDFQEYLAVPEVAAVAGRFLCEGALIEAGLWEDLEAQAVLCVRKVGAALRGSLAESQCGTPVEEGYEEIYR